MKSKHANFIVRCRHPVPGELMFKSTSADEIYAREHMDGMVYLLHYNGRQKSDAAVVSAIDNMAGVRFDVLGECGAKVLIFSGKEMYAHPLYKHIFQGKHSVWMDGKACSAGLDACVVYVENIKC